MDQLQTNFTYNPITEAELFNFVLEAKADINAFLHHLYINMKMLNNSTLEDERKRFDVVQKAYHTKILKK